jgi:3-oxoacyl-[acyl-carrier protein] reductase
MYLLGSLRPSLSAHSTTFIAFGSSSVSSNPMDEMSNLVKNIPAGYVGLPEDAAAVVGFLLSEEARYVNGANIHVSGAWGI